MFRPAFPVAAHSLARLALCVALPLALILGGAAHADAPPVPTTLSGTLSQDDDVAWFDLRLDSADPFRLGTTSYAAGGFAPILALFTASGELLMLDVGSSHVCGSAGAGAADASSGFCWDATLSASLPAGHYQVVLSQDGNAPLGPWLSDGFQQTGRPDYTGQDWLGQAGLQFIQIDGQQRNSAWKLDVEGVAVVPEPSAWALCLAGLLLLRHRWRHAPARHTHFLLETLA